jgi:hypothetical protein
MPWYRLYHLDPHSGHFQRAEELFAADDVSAIHDLQLRQADHPLELWEQGRKVVHIDAPLRPPVKPRAGDAATPAMSRQSFPGNSKELCSDEGTRHKGRPGPKSNGPNPGLEL